MSDLKVDCINLAGLVFGDGYITKRGEICFHHSIKQEEYILFKKSVLESMGFKTRVRINNNISGFSTNKGIVVSTTPTTFGKRLRESWYPESKKCVPINLLKQFGWYEWSFVYQDDGRVNKISHYNNLINGVRQRIATEPTVNRYEFALGYPTDEELNILMLSLNNLGVTCSVMTRKDGQRRIVITRAKSKTLFFENINPHIHDSMRYKINIKPTFSYTS